MYEATFKSHSSHSKKRHLEYEASSHFFNDHIDQELTSFLKNIFVDLQ